MPLATRHFWANPSFIYTTSCIYIWTFQASCFHKYARSRAKPPILILILPECARSMSVFESGSGKQWLERELTGEVNTLALTTDESPVRVGASNQGFHARRSEILEVDRLELEFHMISPRALLPSILSRYCRINFDIRWWVRYKTRENYDFRPCYWGSSLLSLLENMRLRCRIVVALDNAVSDNVMTPLTQESTDFGGCLLCCTDYYALFLKFTWVSHYSLGIKCWLVALVESTKSGVHQMPAARSAHLVREPAVCLLMEGTNARETECGDAWRDVERKIILGWIITISREWRLLSFCPG